MSLEKRGFLIYSNYVGLKTHFNTENFWFNLNGKPKVLPKTYRERQDRIWFERLAKNYSINKIPAAQEFLISAFLFNKKIWIGDIVENENLDKFHTLRMKSRTALTRTIEQDIFKIEEYLIDENLSIKSLLFNEGRPELLFLSRKLKITLETIALFSVAFKFTGKKSDDIIYDEERIKIEKYAYLIKSDFDIPKIKPLIVDLLKIKPKA